MSKYPKINYIGNKEKISDWIIQNLPIQNGTILDLFCGGCSMSYAFKENGFQVIANDGLYSNYVIAKAIIENTKDKLSLQDLHLSIADKEIKKVEKSISFLTNKLYYENEVHELAWLIEIANNLSEYKNYMFLSLLRRAMIRKIPYSRMNIKWEEIQKLRDEDYSYKKYGRYRHYHNVPFMEHIMNNLDEYNDSVFDNGRKCKAIHYDAYKCINEIIDKVDLIYLDPPYPSTMNKYDDFYGCYDLMFDIKPCIELDLTDKKTFIDNFYKIIEKAVTKTKYLVISLNSRSYPSYDILSEKIQSLFRSIKVYKKEHCYKVSGKENKNKNLEILLVCEV